MSSARAIQRALLLVGVLLLAGCTLPGAERLPPTPTPLTEPYTAAIATAEAGDTSDEALALTYYERGNVHYGMAAFAAALDDYDTAIALDPDNPRLYNNRAVAYATIGQLEKAEADYGTAIALEPDYTRAYQNRLALYEQQGNLVGMAADYAALARLDAANRADHRYQQGVLLLRLEDTTAALRAFDAAIEADPQHADARYERARLRFAAGQLEAARADLDYALRISPRAANVHYAHGLLAHASGETARAISDFTQAISLRPAYVEALIARAAAYRDSGDSDAARADLRRARELAPDDTDIQYTLDVLEMHLSE
jgi:tetratricopeptide (TPR) repeat protein